MTNQVVNKLELKEIINQIKLWEKLDPNHLYNVDLDIMNILSNFDYTNDRVVSTIGVTSGFKTLAYTVDSKYQIVVNTSVLDNGLIQVINVKGDTID